MLIVTRTLTVDDAMPVAVVPAIEPVTLTTASATVVFVGICREFRAIVAATQPMWMGAGFHPAPDGLPWSERGVTPATKSPASETVRTNHHSYEAACAEHAWLKQLPGSRFRIVADTHESGFRLVWTVEVL